LKVIFVQDTISNGGAERSHLEIISKFKETKGSVAYFYEGHELKSAHEQAGVPVHFLGLKGKYDFLRGVLRLVKLIRQEKPDLLVSCLLRASLMARVASKITRVKLVGTLVNDSYGDQRVQEKKAAGGFGKYKFFWILDRMTAGIPVHWISNSKSIAAIHVETLSLDKERISVIYRGRKTNVSRWRKMAGTEFTFLSYGRLIERKGFEELIIAFNEVRKEFKHIRLVIYGEGPSRAKLEALKENLGLGEVVVLPGLHPNVHYELVKADCFVFPSWYEGFSGALIEAMLAGIPIIASAIPMNMEAITPGLTALTFKPKSIEELVTRMKYAITHPDEMTVMGDKAREEATKRFDILLIALSYEKLLHEIIAKN